MSALTAAEKAELRRQKILAKKNMRMAYVNGDRSQLPSTATADLQAPSALPAALLPEVETLANNANGDKTERMALGRADDEGIEPPQETTIPSEMRPLRPLEPPPNFPSPFNAPSFTAYPPQRAVQWKPGPTVRMVSFIILALCFAIACHRHDALASWPVSAIELYLLANMTLGLPYVINCLTDAARNTREQIHPQYARFNRAPLVTTPSIFGTISWITSSYTTIERSICEFSVYLATFLCTWYIMSPSS